MSFVRPLLELQCVQKSEHEVLKKLCVLVDDPTPAKQAEQAVALAWFKEKQSDTNFWLCGLLVHHGGWHQQNNRG